MNRKGVSLALLVVGIALLIYAAQASESFGSEVSRIFTGSPSDETLWFLLGGLVAVCLGIAGLVSGRRRE